MMLKTSTKKQIEADAVVNCGGRMSCLLLKSFRRAGDGSTRWRIVYKVVSTILNSNLGSTGGAHLGAGLRLPHPYNVIVSEYSRVGEGCTLFHNVTLGSNEKPPITHSAPVLGADLYVGAGAILVGGITVGDGAKIGAGAVVTKDVPAGATVVGENRIVCMSKATEE